MTFSFPVQFHAVLPAFCDDTVGHWLEVYFAGRHQNSVVRVANIRDVSASTFDTRFFFTPSVDAPLYK